MKSTAAVTNLHHIYETVGCVKYFVTHYSMHSRDERHFDLLESFCHRQPKARC